jgi:hypothetical protein
MAVACAAVLVAGGCGGSDDEETGDAAPTEETTADDGAADGSDGAETSPEEGGGGSATITIDGGETIDFTLSRCSSTEAGFMAQGDSEDGTYGLVFSRTTVGGELSGAAGITVNSAGSGVQFDPTDLEVDGDAVSGEVTLETSGDVPDIANGATATVEITC